jgi:hypothetical protein
MEVKVQEIEIINSGVYWSSPKRKKKKIVVISNIPLLATISLNPSFEYEGSVGYEETENGFYKPILKTESKYLLDLYETFRTEYLLKFTDLAKAERSHLFLPSSRCVTVVLEDLYNVKHELQSLVMNATSSVIPSKIEEVKALFSDKPEIQKLLAEFETNYNVVYNALGESSSLMYWTLPLIFFRPVKKTLVSPQEVFSLDYFLDKKPSNKINVYELIEKLVSCGEEPTVIKVTGPTHYATQEDINRHTHHYKNWKIDLTKEEVEAVKEHFSFLIGKTYHEAKKEAAQEGMDLWVRQIEGFTKNKSSKIRPGVLSVVIKDPRPVNSSCPSELGTISNILGLVKIKGK